MTDLDEEFESAPERVSKSQLKRESAALQDLGEELIALPLERLNSFDLPVQLLEAVRQAQSITQHGALKRQRKFIGKLLREIDAEPIRKKLAGLKNQSAQAIGELHRIERWRDRLLGGDENEINGFLAAYPSADRQKLRQLVRDARKERIAQSPPRSARLLFKYVRNFVTAEGTREPAEYLEE
ncbi:MAG TPA: ribosome biogenesis factor YjgA [Methylococcaceae bacterium]|nr:ribosome biogenesis factor YjgA [Methylococcaceae bacterium]